MKKLIPFILLITFSGYVQSAPLKLWCKGVAQDGGRTSLIVTINKKLKNIVVTWGDAELINNTYKTSETMYSVTILKSDGENIERMFQLDRRSLKYSIFAPVIQKGWFSEGNCTVDDGPKI
jgi:hypothetical protein